MYILLRRLRIILILLMYSGCSVSTGLPHDAGSRQPDIPSGESPARYVQESFIMGHIHQLASDSLKGRGTGQPGSRLAADYLERFYTSGSFTAYETMPVMRQSFVLEGVFWDSTSYDVYHADDGDTLFLSRSQLKKGTGAHFYPLSDGTRGHDAPVVFAGDGIIDISTHGTRSVRDKLENAWAMVFEPGRDEDRSRTAIVRDLSIEYGAHGVIFIPEGDPKVWEDKSVEMSRQLERPGIVRRPDERFSMAGGSAGVSVSVHPDLARSILGLNSPAQLDSLHLHWNSSRSGMMPRDTGYRFRTTPSMNVRTFEEDNVIAVIPGADEPRSREIVVISAHYDHLGLGEPDESNDIVYSGADDNASGTAVLLQIARAFHEAASDGYHPSRTLVFLHTAAEEWGLHGARYFTENPLFPEHDIVANVNVDMVGRVDDVYSGRQDSSYIYVIGAGMVSTMLDELVRQANSATANLILDDTYNDTGHHLQLYRRSDHWPFAQSNIPFVFFFSGLHEYYHQPSDTPEKIAGPLLASRAGLITELIWYLAETTVRPESDIKQFGRSRTPSR